ncbi:MAG: PilZ domain-containing protein [Acidobacteria bacterium]|nr:PilZ domain-containing protein [Acidobacteriota bacterium]
MQTDIDLNRRGDRVSLNLPIHVAGTDAQGRPFREETRTVVVTRHGAKIILSRELQPEAEVTIRYPRTGREAAARVVGDAGTIHDGHQYGVEVLDPSVNLWGIHFPTAAEASNAVGRVLLECTSCHAQEISCLDGLSLGVFQANRQISCPCMCSEAMTIWTEVSSDGTPGSRGAGGVAVGPKLASSARSRNARETVSQSWRINACVRTPAYGEDLVLTDNPSKDGVRFMSEQRYVEDEKLEIALPYQPGGGNVFIPAQIKWTSGEPEDGVTLYGVTYLRRIRKATRHSATVEVHIGIIGVGLRLTGRIVDLSMTGVMMQTSTKLDPDTHVRLGIEMGVDTFRTIAVVRRTVSGVGIAFEFAQMTQRDRQLLGRLILSFKLSAKS